MIFLDDFLEMLEELPGELRDRCREMKEIDAEITASQILTSKEVEKYFATYETMREEERKAKLRELQAKYASLRARSEEKIALSERMQELLEKYTQHLEREKMHLKFELEADNAGVTQMIEKRFSDYVDEMFSQRKERRKRPLPSTSSNGTSNGKREIGGEDIAPSRRPSTSIPPPSQKVSRVEREGEGPATPVITPVVRGRKLSVPLTPEESLLKEARREAIRAQLQASLHLKTSGGEKEKEPWSSSSHRSRPSPSTPNTSGSSQFVFSPLSSPHPPLSSPAVSSMPNFISTESRHGRARKLTSRVQEMFNSNQSLAGHRERTRHSSTTAPSVAPSTPSPNIGGREGREEEKKEEEGGEEKNARWREEGDEEGNDEKPWCFCNEKSYGGMVACDNKECPYEWFHWPCVGLEAAPRGKWFCPHCEEKMANGH